MGLGDIISRLALDNRPFNENLDASKKKVSQFERAVQSVGGGLRSSLLGFFSVAAITRMASSVNNAVKAIDQVAQQFSVTTEEAQKLQMQADLTGQSIEKLVESAGGLPKALKEAANNEPLFEERELSAVRGAGNVGKTILGELGKFGLRLFQGTGEHRYDLQNYLQEHDTTAGTRAVLSMQAKLAQRRAARAETTAGQQKTAEELKALSQQSDLAILQQYYRELYSRNIGAPVEGSPRDSQQAQTLREMNGKLSELIKEVRRNNSTGLRLPSI